MNWEVFITCAVTGSGDTAAKSEHVPRSPKQVADAAIDAAKAGAAIVHCHARDPKTGAPVWDTESYREITGRIRDSATDTVLNLTAGHGGDLFLGGVEHPLPPDSSSDMAGALARCKHLEICRPEIATLDCGSMNFGEGGYIMANTPDMLRAMARRMQELGVKPEIEAFDTGHLHFAKKLASEGLIDAPPLVQLCMGIPWGAPDDFNTLAAMVNNIPPGWIYSGFSIGRMELPFVAAIAFAGGNARVGLEDNLYLRKGEKATNAQLVERAAAILSGMGARILSPAEARQKLAVQKRAPL